MAELTEQPKLDDIHQRQADERAQNICGGAGQGKQNATRQTVFGRKPPHLSARVARSRHKGSGTASIRFADFESP